MKAHSEFPIVGVGASAGGLEAFTQLLRCLPNDTGLAFVLIQHLDRTHPSHLSETLAKATAMSVRQAEHGMRIEPSHVYVIAPNTDIAVEQGLLVVSPRSQDGAQQHLPVDFFLRSLAAERGSRAIGVILSGSASDGTEGLRAIRAQDGITFAQDPRAAKYPSMPQSATDAGVVDQCLDIPELAAELARLSRHPYERLPEVETDAREQSVHEAIFACVRNTVGVDFSEFKPSTLTRRLARRMALRNVAGARAYLTLLEAEPDEVRALYEDMLIHVTAFFRDPDVFVAVRTLVFPELVQYKPEGAAVRIWAAGCSTGEEVYSLAIAWLEFAAETSSTRPVQVFGSDVSEFAIRKARAGVYDESALRGVSVELRERYFDRTDGGYCIQKRVRDLCVFVRHDLVSDPPFSKLDLVSCRNVLIYFDQSLQSRVLPTLHYCLNQPGFLLLGQSENITGWGRLFSVADKGHRIWRRTAAASGMGFVPRLAPQNPPGRTAERVREASPALAGGLAKHLDRLLLARYCPPGVLIRENLDVVLFRGQTGAYLQAAPGQPQNSLIGMARGGLIVALQETIAQAKRDMVRVRRSNVEVDQDGAVKRCDLVVEPFSGIPTHGEPLYIVLFEEPTQVPIVVPQALDAQLDASQQQRRNARLEHELAATKEYLHTLVEEQTRATDELGTSNEELISGNEELQSTNEELETAKEELQSINEELTTLNDELRSRNHEVALVNSDLLNFALTVDIAIVTLDMQQRIRRFTPRAESVLGLAPSDTGRFLHDLELALEPGDLKQEISEVMRSGEVREREVKDRHGRWFRMHIRPYTAPDRSIDGVLLSLVDVDVLKQVVSQAQLARAEAERANSAKDDFLATLSHELRTPLSSMLLNAQRLRTADKVGSTDVQRVGESLERATLLQVKLIDDLLDVSRIVADKLTLDCRPIEVSSVVHAALEQLSPLAQAKGQELFLSVDATVGMVWADPVRLQQVISNLLNNAIKFTPRGGKVTIAVDAVDRFARLRVTDTGIGIEAAFLPRLFLRFSQRDSSITRTHGGLGLGLALVRHLVELHGGSVRADSDGLGKGSTFSVTFPVARRSDKLEPVKAASTIVERTQVLDRPGKTQKYAGLSALRVLVIDDDLQTREAVLEVLQYTGAVVELAASVAEGLRAIASFRPQVILCDIAMPDEDGYAFMRKLKALQASSAGVAIPVLALTALASEEDRQRVLGAGFRMHLAKPIDIDRLRDSVLALSELTRAPSA